MQQPKMGGQSVTRLFIKGNEELADALLSQADGGSRLDKGVRESVQAVHDGKFEIEVVWETAVSTDILLQQLNGTPFPAELKAQDLDDAFLTNQFESKLFSADSDLIVLSIQPDMLYTRWRHQGDGTLICPPLDWQQSWSAAQRDWFMQNFSPVGKLSADEYKENLTNLIHALKEQTKAHIVLVGVSSFDPDDQTHSFHGIDDTLTLRAHRFNLVMLELSYSEGITFIDVDRLLAELGCDDHVQKALAYSDAAYRAICDDFVRVMTDVSFFEERPILVQMGQRKR